MLKCLECEYWKQLSNNGEDVCLATQDEHGIANVIPISEDVPEWCQMQGGDAE